MMKKRYEVRGMMEWHPEFRAGRTRLRVSFTGGHLCGGACTPAVFETSDPVVQAVIEGSAAFRSGRISIGAVMEACHAERDFEGVSASCACGAAVGMTDLHDAPAETVMEFDDIDCASDFLQEKKGIPIDRVFTREQCEAEAKSLGIRLVIKDNVKR